MTWKRTLSACVSGILAGGCFGQMDSAGSLGVGADRRVVQIGAGASQPTGARNTSSGRSADEPYEPQQRPVPSGDQPGFGDRPDSEDQPEGQTDDTGQLASGPALNGRPILVGEVENARDLGGTRLEQGGVVAFDALYRGAPLAGLSKQGCAEFERLGIRTVIDLRTDVESTSLPESPCVAAHANVVHAPLPIPYDVSARDYLGDLYEIHSIAEAFRAFGDPQAYPIYFHCTWGRDRTGVVAAVVLLALGASRGDILQEYLLSRSSVGAYPASLDAMLDEIARSGGIDGYFADAGIPPDQLEVLRTRAVSASEP